MISNFAPYTQGDTLPDEPAYKANFSWLMQRCYELTERDYVPFQPLTVEAIP